ncbi:MAG: chemotaxis-specific protein-glutamate methyltransferase CheB [Archangium sp.]|nr:chemotaxis-specific protein-glutamate methyltransferase CheB [Archangium sp.]MDP3156079.1 chemotaxis-specific protein-glutamate methyltransferase CheB [Archangium sp.]MDP3572837.1 chemotaxis-specific protein-glutamate methyltransferase CheB [Archangium sp.]
MIRCLIADDSPTFRWVLRELLTRDRDIEVVGEAVDGADALAQTLALRPDVLTLDLNMPRLDGLGVLREIMARAALPILVLTAAVDAASDQISFQALSLGALEVLAKPRADDPQRFAAQAEEIRRAVRTIAGSKPVMRPEQLGLEPSAPFLTGAGRGPVACIGIATSTGGPAALQRILSALPADFPVPILVVQHTADGFTPALVKWLASQTKLRVGLAEHGEPLAPGTVRFAPDRRHLMVSLGRLRLDDGPAVRGFRPAGSVLLASLAREFGPAAAGFVLTGMGEDGVSGLRLMRERGGATFAQGRASSVVWGMPRAAIEQGAAEWGLELDQVAPAMTRLASPASAGGTRRQRLLLVDDSQTILLLEQRFLQDRYELFMASDGRQAVDAAHKLKPDVVLMDYSMPVMNGVEALRELKAHAATRSLPVIMVTSETTPAVLQSCRDSGCVDIVRKPITAVGLHRAVAVALQRR